MMLELSSTSAWEIQTSRRGLPTRASISSLDGQRVYLLYLDASGTPDVADGAHANFVLLGLSIHEGNWFALEKRVAALKARYEFPDIPLELHCLSICNSISEQDEISGFEGLARPERRARVLGLRQQKLAGKVGSKRKNARRRYRETEAVVHLSHLERSQTLRGRPRSCRQPPGDSSLCRSGEQRTLASSHWQDERRKRSL